MLTPDALADLMASDAPHAVLDVRERGAYERGHVYRSTTLPRRQLEWRLPTLVTAPATPIALIDADGALAPLAAATLGTMGYRDVQILGAGLAVWRAAGRRVAPHDLMRRIDKRDDMVIVDSRTFEEYHRGCIPGSISVPGGELVLRIGELVERPETTIVVHCGGRTRSYIGAESLRRMHLPNPIVALENGTMGWELAGLTLERGATRTAPAPGSRSHGQPAATAKRVAVEDGVRFVGVDDVRRLWDARRERNVYLVDVRTADEYEADHIAGSIWAPGGQAVQAADDYFAVRGASFVFICDELVRSVMTAAWFTRMGVPDVAVLAGGVSAWRDAGGLIEGGQPSPAPFGWDAARAATRYRKPGELGDAVVVDVGMSDEYARGHVPGAGWICRSRLESKLPSAAPDRVRPLVLTCGDGVASTLAAATARGLGYKDVSVLDGGTRAWADAGRPLEQDATRLWDEPDDVVLKPYQRGREAMEAYLKWEEALDPDGTSAHRLIRDTP